MRLAETLAAIVVLAALGASCAAIGGLGDFQEVDCAGACADGGADGSTDGPAGDSPSGPDGGALTFATIGGKLSGLKGTGLILKDNGGDDLQLGADGPFTFPAKVRNGEPYAVTLSSQPSSPTQTCSVARGSGTVKGADVTDVSVTCATTAYTVGGLVVGSGGAAFVLTNNGGDNLPVGPNGPFTFATKVASGSPFAVAVKTQPATGGPCAVSGGSGAVGVGNVTSVVVNCAPGTYTIGGTVSGLTGTVVLQDNGGNDLSLNSSGSFAFSQTIATGGPYAVTVKTPPAYPPRSQTCTITNGSGNVAAANVTNVTVACTTNSFTVGGTVSGLSGTLVLKNNGADPRTLTTNGAFTFPTAVVSGNTYAATIGTQPSGQTCSLTNASGSVTNGAVTTISVACGTAGDPGILCGATSCDPATMLCCLTNGVPACATKCTGPGTAPIICDDAHDCPSGQVCCGSVNGTTVNSIYCTSASMCTTPKAYYCDPAIATPCPNGGTCTLTNTPPGYYRCF